MKLLPSFQLFQQKRWSRGRFNCFFTEPSKCYANFVLDFSSLDFFLACKFFSRLFFSHLSFFPDFFLAFKFFPDFFLAFKFFSRQTKKRKIRNTSSEIEPDRNRIGRAGRHTPTTTPEKINSRAEYGFGDLMTPIQNNCFYSD